jgi:hypothetical protein
MNLALQPRRVIETADRRVLGAFQLSDAVTGLPIGVPAAIEARRAFITVAGGPEEIALPDGAVRIVQSRGGAYVLFRAPFFDAYTSSFGVPAVAPVMSLRVSVSDAGPHYLPQEFQFDLPRPLDPDTAGSVFEPQDVGLLRAPGASAQDGWAVLRVSVRLAGPGAAVPLPGVLVRVFRSPRAAQDRPMGVGMTEWRGAVRGEALVPVPGVQRFRPGAGSAPIETEQPIELEATRDTGFTGSGGSLPDVPRLASGGAGVIRHIDRGAGAQLAVVVRPDERPAGEPDSPIHVRAGREYVVHVTMP